MSNAIIRHSFTFKRTVYRTERLEPPNIGHRQIPIREEVVNGELTVDLRKLELYFAWKLKRGSKKSTALEKALIVKAGSVVSRRELEEVKASEPSTKGLESMLKF
jgi:hypothetical protein